MSRLSLSKKPIFSKVSQTGHKKSVDVSNEKSNEEERDWSFSSESHGDSDAAFKRLASGGAAAFGINSHSHSSSSQSSSSSSSSSVDEDSRGTRASPEIVRPLTHKKNNKSRSPAGIAIVEKAEEKASSESEEMECELAPKTPAPKNKIDDPFKPTAPDANQSNCSEWEQPDVAAPNLGPLNADHCEHLDTCNLTNLFVSPPKGKDRNRNASILRYLADYHPEQKELLVVATFCQCPAEHDSVGSRSGKRQPKVAPIQKDPPNWFACKLRQDFSQFSIRYKKNKPRLNNIRERSNTLLNIFPSKVKVQDLGCSNVNQIEQAIEFDEASEAGKGIPSRFCEKTGLSLVKLEQIHSSDTLSQNDECYLLVPSCLEGWLKSLPAKSPSEKPRRSRAGNSSTGNSSKTAQTNAPAHTDTLGNLGDCGMFDPEEGESQARCYDLEYGETTLSHSSCLGKFNFPKTCKTPPEYREVTEVGLCKYEIAKSERGARFSVVPRNAWVLLGRGIGAPPRTIEHKNRRKPTKTAEKKVNQEKETPRLFSVAEPLKKIAAPKKKENLPIPAKPKTNVSNSKNSNNDANNVQQTKKTIPEKATDILSCKNDEPITLVPKRPDTAPQDVVPASDLKRKRTPTAPKNQDYHFDEEPPTSDKPEDLSRLHLTKKPRLCVAPGNVCVSSDPPGPTIPIQPAPKTQNECFHVGGCFSVLCENMRAMYTQQIKDLWDLVQAERIAHEKTRELYEIARRENSQSNLMLLEKMIDSNNIRGMQTTDCDSLRSGAEHPRLTSIQQPSPIRSPQTMAFVSSDPAVQNGQKLTSVTSDIFSKPKNLDEPNLNLSIGSASRKSPAERTATPSLTKKPVLDSLPAVNEGLPCQSSRNLVQSEDAGCTGAKESSLKQQCPGAADNARFTEDVTEIAKGIENENSGGDGSDFYATNLCAQLHALFPPSQQ